MGLELKECYLHGIFRGEKCPECGLPSKLVMTEEEVNRLSKILAGMLRHFPERYGIKLSDHGWVKISTILPVIRVQSGHFKWLTQKHIEAMVQTDPKERYQINENHEIRARYGHTIPVNVDDLDSSNIPDRLYYQTTAEEYEFIRETGINPSDKTWIHLSLTYRQAFISGLFHVSDPLIIEVDSKGVIESGLPIYRATEDIFLLSRVPAEYIREANKEEVEPTAEEREEIERVKIKRERKRDESAQ